MLRLSVAHNNATHSASDYITQKNHAIASVLTYLLSILIGCKTHELYFFSLASALSFNALRFKSAFNSLPSFIKVAVSHKNATRSNQTLATA